jgi:hypothetical protein
MSYIHEFFSLSFYNTVPRKLALHQKLKIFISCFTFIDRKKICFFTALIFWMKSYISLYRRTSWYLTYFFGLRKCNKLTVTWHSNDAHLCWYLSVVSEFQGLHTLVSKYATYSTVGAQCASPNFVVFSTVAFLPF